MNKILREVWRTKDRLSAQARDMKEFLEQMDAWSKKHPHKGPVVHSPEELQERLRRKN